jgi:hypothetical protein
MRKDNHVIEDRKIDDKEKQEISIDEQIDILANIIIDTLLTEKNENSQVSSGTGRIIAE